MLVLVHVTCEPRPPKPGTGWPLRNTPTGFGSFGGSPIQSSTQKLKRRLADCTPHAGTEKVWQNSVDFGEPAASTPIHFADGSASSDGHHTGYGGTSTAAKPLHATAKSAGVNGALLSGIDGAFAAVYTMPLCASLRSVRHWYGAVAGVWAPAAVVSRTVVRAVAKDSDRVERMAVLRVGHSPGDRGAPFWTGIQQLVDQVGPRVRPFAPPRHDRLTSGRSPAPTSCRACPAPPCRASVEAPRSPGGRVPF